MQVPVKQLKPLSSLQLTPEEHKIVAWMRKAAWEPQADAREPIPYKAKVPEFFGGVRLYNMQSGGALGPLDLFIKKIEYQGVITKQSLYPVSVQGTARYLSLAKADLDNLGVGGDEYDED
jgi:hypothetical protein